MTEDRQGMTAFRLGMFAAELLLKGVIQPDFQLCNIGWKDGEPKLVDYADIEIFKLPEELTKEKLRQIAESLFSLADDFQASFLDNSYLRAGFIAEAGILGHMVYEAARDSGYSSFMYTEKKLMRSEHSLMRITKWTDVKAEIEEWKRLRLNKETRMHSLSPDKDNRCNQKEIIEYPVNAYYLHNTDSIFYLLGAKAIGDQEKKATVIMNMAIAARQFGMPYMANGLAEKCKLLSEEQQKLDICDRVIDETAKYVSEYKNIVEKYVFCDEFEFMWLLEDLDITVTR